MRNCISFLPLFSSTFFPSIVGSGNHRTSRFIDAEEIATVDFDDLPLNRGDQLANEKQPPIVHKMRRRKFII